jgi:hypothetical protein
MWPYWRITLERLTARVRLTATAAALHCCRLNKRCALVWREFTTAALGYVPLELVESAAFGVATVHNLEIQMMSPPAKSSVPPDSSVNACFAKCRSTVTAYDHDQGRLPSFCYGDREHGLNEEPQGAPGEP